MGKVSFVIPVFKVEKYLPECLDSLLRQKAAEWEAILIDDGSPDGSGAICDAYAARDKRFCVIHSKNQGVAAARLAGFRKSMGQYVSFIDGDDWIDDNFLSIINDACLEHQPDVIVMKKADSDKGPTETKNYAYRAGFYDRQRLRSEIYPTLMANPANALSEIPGSLWGKVFHREILEDNINYVDTTLFMGEDQVWLWPTLLQANNIVFLDEILYNYRQADGQATQRYHANLADNYLRVIEILRKMNCEKRRYSQYDFSEQIDLMQAQFAINAIDNEFFSEAEGWNHAYGTIKQLSNHLGLQDVLYRIDNQAFGRRKLWLYLLQKKYNMLLLLLQIINENIRRS